MSTHHATSTEPRIKAPVTTQLICTQITSQFPTHPPGYGNWATPTTRSGAPHYYISFTMPERVSFKALADFGRVLEGRPKTVRYVRGLLKEAHHA